jgi:hypothetical protein
MESRGVSVSSIGSKGSKAELIEVQLLTKQLVASSLEDGTRI